MQGLSKLRCLSPRTPQSLVPGAQVLLKIGFPFLRGSGRTERRSLPLRPGSLKYGMLTTGRIETDREYWDIHRVSLIL